MGIDKARHAGKSMNDNKRKIKTESTRQLDTTERAAVHDKPANRLKGSSDQLTSL